MNDANALFRAIPSTDRCLAAIREAARGAKDGPLRDAADAPASLLIGAVRAYWDGVREDIRTKGPDSVPDVSLEARFADMVRFAAGRAAPNLRKVLNGTGVVLHTNTGRAVLADAACRALQTAASSNTTLEFDRETGGRGSRDSLVGPLLAGLAGAEDALVVNNNAAGVLLVLSTFCGGREAVVSRGELVEIGGSFRIPDIMEASGVRLREVGTTNRTHLKDYEEAVGEETAAIVRVHASNFRVVGFHSAVPGPELARLAHSRGILFVEDLGSGSLLDLSDAGMPKEPTVQRVVAEGADLVLFSGDKLLGGPQAGLVAGRRDLIARLRKNPLLRALRCDKLVYAALEATLRLHADPDAARREIPTIRRILLTPAELRRRASTLRRRILSAAGDLCSASLEEDSSRTGGGAFPEHPMPTTLVAVRPSACSATRLKRELLRTSPVVIGRLEDDSFRLDPRTLEPADFPLVAAAVAAALRACSGRDGA